MRQITYVLNMSTKSPKNQWNFKTSGTLSKCGMDEGIDVCVQKDLMILSCLWLLLFSCVQSCPTLCSHMDCSMQASLSHGVCSWSMLKFMPVESVMPSNHLILCCPRLLLSSIFPSIMVFSNKSALRIRWPKYWSFSFSINPSIKYSGFISLKIDWLDLLAFQEILQSLLQHHSLKIIEWERLEISSRKLEISREHIYGYIYIYIYIYIRQEYLYYMLHCLLFQSGEFHDG